MCLGGHTTSNNPRSFQEDSYMAYLLSSNVYELRLDGVLRRFTCKAADRAPRIQRQLNNNYANITHLSDVRFPFLSILFYQ